MPSACLSKQTKASHSLCESINAIPIWAPNWFQKRLKKTQKLTKTLNFQIEREKADLSVQVIQMSERLEEAEGGAEHQVSEHEKDEKQPI